MKEKLAYVNWFPLRGNQMAPYINSKIQPPLRPEVLSATMLQGTERSILKTNYWGCEYLCWI